MGTKQLYALAFTEAARVLAVGGRLLVLSPCRGAILEALEATAPLWAGTPTSSASVNCGGRVALLTVCTPAGLPFKQHWDAARRLRALRPTRGVRVAASAGPIGE